MSKSVLPLFFEFFQFLALHLSLIHFEFIFVYGARKYSDFILLYVTVQFSHQQLLRGLYILACFAQDKVPIGVWVYLRLSILFHWSIFLFLCQYHTVFWASLIAQPVKNVSAMQETRVLFLGQEDPLEKEMGTHSSILAWRIPWTEETCRLQSIVAKSRTRLK